MEYHPYSEIWPLIEGSEFDKLKADIRANGLAVPLITYQGKLLDGRNRERACAATGIAPRYVEATVADDRAALKLVWSLNDQRRHMTVSDRAFAAEQMANIILGHNRYQGRVDVSIDTPTPSMTVSIAQAAEISGVSRGSINRVRVIRDHGTPEQIEQARAGTVGLSTMAEIVRPVRNPRTPRAAAPEPARPPRSTPRLVGGDRPAATPLTREQMDPTWTDADGNWVARHGHVNQLTAPQRARGLFASVVVEMRAAVKAIGEQPDQGLGRRRHSFDAYWLRHLTSPSPRDVARLAEAMEYLRPHIAEAEAALARAQAVQTIDAHLARE